MVPVALIIAMLSLAGCTSDPWRNVVYSADGPLEDINDSGRIDAGRQFTVYEFEVQETVNASALFTPDTAIEYADIRFQDCDTGAGSGTGADRDGGPYDHRDRFHAGKGCITIETRHTEAFDYTLDVTFSA